MGLEIYYLDGEEKSGPHTEQEIHNRLLAGTITHETPIWFEGRREFTPLSHFTRGARSDSSSPIPSIPPPLQLGRYANDEIVKIANTQKVLLWIVLASLIGPILFLPIAVLTGLASLVCTIFLAVHLRQPVAFVYAVFTVVPFLGLLFLLLLNARATRALAERGIKVGFMGVSRKELDELGGSAT